jgi:hypothetical protein
MLYLTSQRTKLGDNWFLESLDYINIIAKTMEQKEQVVGEICKLMCHFPWKAPI